MLDGRYSFRFWVFFLLEHLSRVVPMAAGKLTALNEKSLSHANIYYINRCIPLSRTYARTFTRESFRRASVIFPLENSYAPFAYLYARGPVYRGISYLKGSSRREDDERSAMFDSIINIHGGGGYSLVATNVSAH